MAINFNYTITPNTQFEEKFPQQARGTSVIWTKREMVGIHGLYLVEEHIAQVKLIYIANLKSQFLSNPNTRNLGDTLLGKVPHEISVFDRWWTLRREPWDGKSAPRFTDALRTIEVEHLKMLVKTNNPNVDQWVGVLMALKLKGVNSFDILNEFI
jgi:hypothetical protein